MDDCITSGIMSPFTPACYEKKLNKLVCWLLYPGVLTMKCLNLGCGKRYVVSWTNVDFYSDDPAVIAHDLNTGLPFADGSFDFVYSSHVLEHFTRQKADTFLKECHRVLKPTGVLRVVVPDLELLTTKYLEALQKATENEPGWDANYEWTVLHLFDQMVRNVSGGGMLEYISKEKLVNESFVVQMWGGEARTTIEALRSQRTARKDGKKPSLFKSFRTYLRRKLTTVLLGNDFYSALQIGRFRRSGEIHQWMYDHYSLSKLLDRCGYVQIEKRSHDESYLPEWRNYRLDTEIDGSQYRPDSLYMEGVKA